MKLSNKPYLLEQLIYIFIWLIVFLAPVVIAYLPISSTSEQPIYSDWKSIVFMWGFVILPFFILFCINNFWLAPFFFFKKKYLHFILLVTLLVGLFVWFDVAFIRKGIKNDFVPMRQPIEMRDNSPAEHGRPFAERHYRPFPNDRFRQPGPIPNVMIIPVISRFLVAILMISFNIAIKLLFKSMRDEEMIKELERCKLQSELEYLKYQINPHFFMNTLNNIHALMDSNTGQAQKAIIEFSKMMRYVLYEANNKTILLEREILLLKNYIELMKLRYTDKVNVRVSLPEEIPPVEIPPLLYISFIENAFKHGVSYQTDSTICITMQTEEGNLIFNCSNTNNGKNEEQHRGIGLDNIQKRLKLIYENDYTLSITQSQESFNVLLIIPLL